MATLSNSSHDNPIYIDLGGNLADYIEDAFCLDVNYAPFYPSGLEPTSTQGAMLVRHSWKVK